MFRENNLSPTPELNKVNEAIKDINHTASGVKRAKDKL